MWRKLSSSSRQHWVDTYTCIVDKKCYSILLSPSGFIIVLKVLEIKSKVQKPIGIFLWSHFIQQRIFPLKRLPLFKLFQNNPFISVIKQSVKYSGPALFTYLPPHIRALWYEIKLYTPNGPFLTEDSSAPFIQMPGWSWERSYSVRA